MRKENKQNKNHGTEKNLNNKKKNNEIFSSLRQVTGGLWYFSHYFIKKIEKNDGIQQAGKEHNRAHNCTKS